MDSVKMLALIIYHSKEIGSHYPVKLIFITDKAIAIDKIFGPQIVCRRVQTMCDYMPLLTCRCPPTPVFDPEECQLVDPFLECNEDSDCDGNKICCTTGICGGTTCEPGPITRATPPTPPSNPS